MSSRNTGYQVMLKFATVTGATPISGPFTLENFSNLIQVAFQEPRFLVLQIPGLTTSLSQRHLMLTCLSLLCITQTLWYVDTTISFRNQGAFSVGQMWWMLAQELLCTHGTISCEHPWEVMPDLYLYRDSEEIEK